MNKKSVLQLSLLASVIAAATTAIAVAIPWLPPSAAKERDRIDLTMWLTTGISIFIFAIVCAGLLYAVWKFRVPMDDDVDGPHIHGHSGLEILWTAIPTAFVTVIAIMAAIVLHDNSKASSDALHVKVTGQQFAWTFTYLDGPAKGLSEGSLHMPIDRSTEFTIESKDVIHSFWVPEFGQKQDAVPGQTYRLVVTPTKIGKYPVICTELCGLGHGLMRSQAIVLSQADYDAWAAGAAQGNA